MRELTELQEQQYPRMIQLSDTARQRYLDEGGDPRRRRSGRKGDDYLTESERQEFFALGRQLSGFRIVDSYAQCQGRSWKLPDNSPLLKDETKSEA